MKSSLDAMLKQDSDVMEVSPREGYEISFDVCDLTHPRYAGIFRIDVKGSKTRMFLDTLYGHSYGIAIDEDGTQHLLVEEDGKIVESRSFRVLKELQNARDFYERKFERLPEDIARIVTITPLVI